jgi:hypothetical protein
MAWNSFTLSKRRLCSAKPQSWWFGVNVVASPAGLS